MRGKLISRLSALAMLLLMAAPAMAQDTTTSGGKSVFLMFFYSGDILGTAIIWLLVLMSMATMGFVIMLLITYRRSAVVPDEVSMELEAMLQEKRYREAIEFSSNDPSYLGKLVASGLSEASNGYGAMERSIEETADAETTRALRPVEYLNVIGNIAPMMGLFGTVYGMIRAFERLTRATGRVDPNELAAGISTALVTTFWGLIVAMPALLFYALIRNKIDAMTADGLIMAEELIRPFKPSSRKGGSSSSSSRRGDKQKQPSPKPSGGSGGPGAAPPPPPGK